MDRPGGIAALVLRGCQVEVGARVPRTGRGAAVFGFGNIAEGLADIAKILFGVFLVVMLVFVVLGVTVSKSVT